MSGRDLDLPFVVTASGAEYHLGESNPGVVKIRDIASHLSRINRWAGATDLPISVAQHSVMVAEICERADARAGLYGLLHDVAQYIIGDDSRPKRRWLEQQVGFDVIGRLETRVEKDIFDQLGIEWPVPLAYRCIVIGADDRVLATEHRDLMPDRCTIFQSDPLPRRIKVWHWNIAEERFLHKYSDLCAMSGIRNLLDNLGGVQVE